MKKFLHKNSIYIINAIIVISIIIIALLLNHISPFGSKILGDSDGVIQFKPMLYDFITKIKNHTLTNYSFNNGLGNPFIFNYIYYLSSPFNLIALLFKNPDSMFLATLIIKLLIGSFTMTYYVKSKTNNKYIINICTISYLFSAWFIAHYFMIFWLDVFVLFPLFQKGLEDLLNRQKINTYIISLSLIIICNFYLAFSICCYTLVYFIIYELFYKKDRKKEKYNSFLLITSATIFSIIIIFFFLYFVFDTYLKTGLSLDNYMRLNYTIDLKGFLQSLIYANTHIQPDLEGPTFPNIACNQLILINIIYFFFNSKIKKRDKLFAFLTIVLIIATIFFKPIDYVLNGFHHVRGLTYRYSFIISFLMIKTFIINAKNMNKQDYKKMLWLTSIVIILTIIPFKKMELIDQVFSICSLFIYIILLIFYIDHKYYKLLICITIIIQSLLAFKINTDNNISKEEFLTKDYIKENVRYRKNYDHHLGEYNNYNFYHNAKVTYLMSSLSYNRTMQLTENLGCSTYLSSFLFCSDDNEITNMLLNVKKDNYYLEKLFAVNKNIILVDSGTNNTIKDNIENIVSSMTGINDIYSKHILKAEENEEEYIFHTTYPFYLIEIENEEGNYNTIPQTYLFFKQNKKDGKNKATIYTLNEDKLKEVYNYLSKNQIEYIYYNDNHLKGNINVDNNQIIFTSIPYDESWEIKVDGKKVKPIILLDSLIGIEVEPGKHTIDMKYRNTNYIAPAIISFIALLSFIIFNIKRKN